MSLQLWLPEGKHEEYEVTGTAGQQKEIPFYPYKMYHLDILNTPDSSGNVKVMVNDQSLPQACTLEPGRGREYDAKHPKYWKVTIYFEGSATVRITASR